MTRTVLFLSFCVPLAAVVTVGACGGDDPPMQVIGTGGTGGDGGSGGSDGGNPNTAEGVVSASDASDYETDPEILARAEGDVVVAWTAYKENEASFIGYVTSSDGGSTFGDIKEIRSPDGDSYLQPDIVSDAAGNFRLAFLSFKRSGEGGEVYVATSTDGETFGEPEAITDTAVTGFYGRPRVAVTNGGTMIVTFTQTIDQSPDIIVARSGEGEDWTLTNVTQSNESFGFPYACSARDSLDGRTYITYIRGGDVGLLRSEDDGLTWQGGGRVQQDDVDGPDNQPPSCSARADEVWISFGERKANYLQRLRVAYSVDGGESIANWQTAHDPKAAPYYYNHEIAVEASGLVSVTYYAAAGPGDSVGTFRRTSFTVDEMPPMPPPDPEDEDPGSESVEVFSPIEFDLSNTSDSWLGQGAGLEVRNGIAYMALVSNAQTEAHVVFKKEPL